MKKINIILILLVFNSIIYAGKKNTTDKKVETSNEIEVKGQSRRFNMKLILKTQKDKISFVKTRKNYRDEILSTEP